MVESDQPAQAAKSKAKQRTEQETMIFVKDITAERAAWIARNYSCEFSHQIAGRRTPYKLSAEQIQAKVDEVIQGGIVLLATYRPEDPTDETVACSTRIEAEGRLAKFVSSLIPVADAAL
jgi:hypothetical protein